MPPSPRGGALPPTPRAAAVHKPVAKELSDVTYLASIKVKVGEMGKSLEEGGAPSWEMCSLSEPKAREYARKEKEKLIRYNSRQLSRVYPAGTRFNSSNMKAEDCAAAWSAGCHMNALNFQTFDGAMMLNTALFAINGGCGYVLKPPLTAHVPPPAEALLTHDDDGAGPPRAAPPAVPRDLSPLKLKLTVVSGQYLPKTPDERCRRERWDDYHPDLSGCDGEFDAENMHSGNVASPLVEVEVMGGYVNQVSVEKFKHFYEETWTQPQGFAGVEVQGEDGLQATDFRASTLWANAKESDQALSPVSGGNGLLPSWNFKSQFVSWQPRVAFVSFRVFRETRKRLMGRASGRELLAYECIPMTCLREGYRSVPLRSPKGALISNCALLVHIKQNALEVPPPLPPPPAPPPEPPRPSVTASRIDTPRERKNSCESKRLHCVGNAVVGACRAASVGRTSKPRSCSPPAPDGGGGAPSHPATPSHQRSQPRLGAGGGGGSGGGGGGGGSGRFGADSSRSEQSPRSEQQSLRWRSARLAAMHAVSAMRASACSQRTTTAAEDRTAAASAASGEASIGLGRLASRDGGLGAGGTGGGGAGAGGGGRLGGCEVQASGEEAEPPPPPYLLARQKTDAELVEEISARIVAELAEADGVEAGGGGGGGENYTFGDGGGGDGARQLGSSSGNTSPTMPRPAVLRRPSASRPTAPRPSAVKSDAASVPRLSSSPGSSHKVV